MTDQRFTELLMKELADEISGEESVELNLILAEHPALRTEYDSLQQYFKAEEQKDKSIDTVYDRIKTQIDIPSPINKTSSVRLWLQTAAALIVIASGVFWYAQRNNSSQINATTWSTASTKAKQMRTVVLADGSTVQMNAVSSLRYPAKFSGKSREVFLSGEAMFEVKKDANHPFIVHTEDLQVKVLGTIFVVKAYKNDDFTEATLFKGRVAVSLTANPDGEFILKPNDKLNFKHLAAMPTLSKVLPFYEDKADGYLENGWTRHELIFKNTSFGDVSKLFERWYDLKITFKQEDLKALNFTGSFKNESEIEALNSLKLIENFSYSIEGKNVTIFK